MTHHTDAERAEFELMRFAFESKGSEAYKAWLIEVRDGDSYKPWDVVNDWRSWQTAWQAARRAPAAVPQGWKLVPVESTEAMARAFRADDAPGYFCMTTLRCADFSERYAAMLAAAPQPREAAPVPQFSRIAQKKLDYLLEAGEAITGYAIENKDGRRGAIDCHGFVYWWQDAAAPQPPANET